VFKKKKKKLFFLFFVPFLPQRNQRKQKKYQGEVGVLFEENQKNYHSAAVVSTIELGVY
jgi:hypothetical protein